MKRIKAKTIFMSILLALTLGFASLVFAAPSMKQPFCSGPCMYYGDPDGQCITWCDSYNVNCDPPSCHPPGTMCFEC